VPLGRPEAIGHPLVGATAPPAHVTRSASLPSLFLARLAEADMSGCLSHALCEISGGCLAHNFGRILALAGVASPPGAAAGGVHLTFTWPP
jgi:hypothetical protein